MLSREVLQIVMLAVLGCCALVLAVRGAWVLALIAAFNLAVSGYNVFAWRRRQTPR